MPKTERKATPELAIELDENLAWPPTAQATPSSAGSFEKCTQSVLGLG